MTGDVRMLGVLTSDVTANQATLDLVVPMGAMDLGDGATLVALETVAQITVSQN